MLFLVVLPTYLPCLYLLLLCPLKAGGQAGLGHQQQNDWTSNNSKPARKRGSDKDSLLPGLELPRCPGLLTRVSEWTTVVKRRTWGNAPSQSPSLVSPTASGDNEQSCTIHLQAHEKFLPRSFRLRPLSESKTSSLAMFWLVILCQSVVERKTAPTFFWFLGFSVNYSLARIVHYLFVVTGSYRCVALNYHVSIRASASSRTLDSERIGAHGSEILSAVLRLLQEHLDSSLVTVGGHLSFNQRVSSLEFGASSGLALGPPST